MPGPPALYSARKVPSTDPFVEGPSPFVDRRQAGQAPDYIDDDPEEKMPLVSVSTLSRPTRINLPTAKRCLAVARACAGAVCLK